MPGTPDRNENDLRLQDCSGSTINELNWKSPTGQVPLPLPQQDRAVMEQRIERNARRVRFSIRDSMMATSLVCLILALTNWMSLPVLTLCLGCTTIVLLLGFFDSWLGKRQRVVATWLLLISYLAAAALSLLRTF